MNKKHGTLFNFVVLNTKIKQIPSHWRCLWRNK